MSNDKQPEVPLHLRSILEYGKTPQPPDTINPSDVLSYLPKEPPSYLRHVIEAGKPGGADRRKR